MPTLHFLYYCLVGDKTNIINNSISSKQLFQLNRNDKWCDHISLDFKHSIFQADTYHTNTPNPVQEIQTSQITISDYLFGIRKKMFGIRYHNGKNTHARYQ